MMNQPLLNSVRIGAHRGGTFLHSKVNSLWAILLTVLCLFGMTLPSQAQPVFTIGPSPSTGGTLTEGTGGTRTYFVRIRLSGGNSGQTYRIFYQALEGSILFDPQKPSATYDTSCDAFSRQDFDGSVQQADFAGGAPSSQDLGITVYSDEFDEGNSSAGSPYFNQEYFHVSLLSAANVTPAASRDGSIPQVGTDPNPSVTGDSDTLECIIVDDDQPPTLTVRQIADQGPQTITRSDGFTDRDFPDSFFPEGAAGQNNTVRLYVTGTQVSGKQIQFRWRTFSGTATQDSDYAGQDNIVTIAPNSAISQTFDRNGGACGGGTTHDPAVQLTIPIIGDNVDETDESFVVDLRDPNGVYPSNAGITSASAQDGTSGFAVTATIKDDDAPTASISDTELTETDAGTTNATFQVKLSKTSPQAVRVDYTTDLQLFLSGIPNGSAVPYTVNGLPPDYQTSVGKVTFQPGETTKFISIKVNGDIIPEGESSANRFETFPVDLFIGNNGLPYQPNSSGDLNDTLGVSFTDAEGIAQIDDDDRLPQLSFKATANNVSGDVVVNEGDLDPNSGQPKQQIASFVVILDTPSGLPVSVSYSTSDGTAIDGVGDNVTATNPADYQATSSTITFNPGETQQVVTHVENDQFGNPVTKTGVVVFGDVVDETDETFFVNLSNAVNATVLDSQAQATIKDDDGPFVTVNGGTVNNVVQDNVSGPEGDTGTSPFNFTVSLSAPSPQTITVQLSTADGSAVSTAPNPDFVPITNQTLTFLPGETSKVVTVNVNGDIADERNETFSLNIISVTNAQDPNLVGGNGDSQAIGTIVDDDPTPTIAIADQSVNEGDSGNTNLTFTVQLSAPTFQNVSFNYSTANGTAKLSDNDYLAASGQLVITPGATTQSFTVPIVGDTTKEADETFFVNITNVVNADVNSPVSDTQAIGTILNDDQAPAGFTITPTSLTTTESGSSATFTVRLNRQPTADVTMQFTSSDTSEGLVSVGNSAPAPFVNLTFTPQNYALPQTVKVTGQDDTLVDGDIVYLVNSENAQSTDALYQGLNPVDVAVTNTDDEVPGFQVNPTSVTVSETGTTATFTVRLNVAPTSNVVINLSSSDTSEGIVSPSSLTFTPANGTQTQLVTVTGVDDALRDGDQNYTITLSPATSADARYNGLDPQDVTATTTDNETPGILVTPSSGLQTTEASGAGRTATFNIQLTSPPTSSVTIALSSSDTTEGTVSPSQVTFDASNFSTPKTVTITGVDDALDDGDVAYTIITAPATSADTDYNNLDAVDVSVTNLDNEVPGLIVNPTSLTVNENQGTKTFTVRLATQPSSNVDVPVSSEQPTLADVNPATLTFTPANFSVPQTVTVSITDNLIDDGDKNFNIILGQSTSTDPNYNLLNTLLPITIVDNDTAGVTVAPATGLRTTEAGGTATFTIKLNSQPTGSVTISLSSSDTSEGTVALPSVTFDATNFNTPQTVTVTGVDDDIDDGNVAYSIITSPAQSGDLSYNGLNANNVGVTNLDNDTAGITVTPTSGLTTVERGASATFTIVLNSQPTGTVFINLSSSDASEGVPSTSRVVFSTSNWNVPQTVTVRPVDEFEADGNQPYTIITAAATSTDTGYNGLDAADVQLTNVDDDTSGISAVPNSSTTNGVLVTREDGARVSFSVKLLSQPNANVVVKVSTSDTTEGAASPASLTFTSSNWNKTQVVFVSGVDDSIEDGHINYTINMTSTSADAVYNGQSVPGFAARNLDNDDKTLPNVAITTPTDNQVFRSIRQVAGTASDANDPNLFYVSGVIKVQVSLFRFDNPSTPANEAGYFNSNTGQYEAAQNLNTQLIDATYNAARNAWVANLPQTGPNSLAEGRYRLTAYATDKAGNRRASAVVRFTVDMTAPVVTITTPANGVTLATLPQAKGTATDVGGSGVNRVEVTVIRQANNANGLPAGYLAKDGSFTATFSAANNRLPATLSGSNWTVNLPTLPPAVYSIVAYAFDNGGLGANPVSHRFTIAGGEEFTGNATFLISVPYSNGTGVTSTTTPAKAFSVPPIDPTTGVVNYRLERYDPINQKYVALGNNSTIKRGEGYALTPVNRGTHILRPSEDSTRKGLSSTVQEFQITLRNQPSLAPDDPSNGYNLIGDPFDPALFSSAEWLNARVTANIGGQTFTGTVAEAADRNILDRRLFTFDPATNGFSPVTGNLLPFRGYFARTFVDGVQVNLKAVQ